MSESDETIVIETPVEATPAEPTVKAKAKPKKVIKAKFDEQRRMVVEKPAKEKAAKPVKGAKEKTKAVKASSNGKVSKTKGNDANRLTYSQIMSTALPDGSLRKPFIHVLTGLSKAQYPMSLGKVVKASKIVARGVAPSLKFLSGEGLVKVSVTEDEGNCYVITASGRKALEKAAK